MGIHEGVTKMAQHWAQAPMPREQIVLFSPTLEEAISEDHPVRLLDEDPFFGGDSAVRMIYSKTNLSSQIFNRPRRP